MELKKIFLLISASFILYSCTSTPKESIEEQIPERTRFENFIVRAESGDAEAMVQIGMSYEEGSGVPVNYESAFNWYRNAAAKGNSHAYYRLGLLYEFGNFVEQDSESAHEWFLSSGATGFFPAIKKLIEYYDSAPDEQLMWIKKGMEFNDPYSNYRYGLFLEKDNKAEALDYFKKSVSSDSYEIKGLLAQLSLSGQFEYFKERAALENLKAAAESGDTRSQTFLGWLYEFGTLVDRDLENSFELYSRAALKKEVLAVYNLSRFYGEGLFVKKDPHLSHEYFKAIPEEFESPVLEDLLLFCRKRSLKEQQIVLYRFKATANDLEAYYNLGILTDESDAFQWFWLAAEAGHIPSMYELGKLYFNDSLSDFDPVKAAAWIMVYENKSETPPDGLTSRDITSTLTNPEKLEVSRLFTSLFYGKSERANNSGLLR